MALSNNAKARVFGGSIRLFLIRLGLISLMSLPAFLGAFAGVADGPGRAPYYTETAGKLPLIHLVRLIRDLPGAVLPAIFIALILCVLLDQLLLGGAVYLANPARPLEPKAKVMEALSREGLAHLWPFLRAIGLGFVLFGLGGALIRAFSKKLFSMGEEAGWTGKTMTMTLPMLTSALLLFWFASVAAWLFWCRVISAADGRRKVRRSGLLALKVFIRRPMRSWGLFALLSTISIVLSGAVLFAWRLSEPRGASIFFWLIGFLATLALQAMLWVFFVRDAMLLYSSDVFSNLRAAPDQSFRLWSRCLAFVKPGGPKKAVPKEPAPEVRDVKDGDAEPGGAEGPDEAGDTDAKAQAE